MSSNNQVADSKITNELPVKITGKMLPETKYTAPKPTSSSSFKPPMSKESQNNNKQNQAKEQNQENSGFFSYIKHMFGGKQQAADNASDKDNSIKKTEKKPVKNESVNKNSRATSEVAHKISHQQQPVPYQQQQSQADPVVLLESRSKDRMRTPPQDAIQKPPPAAVIGIDQKNKARGKEKVGRQGPPPHPDELNEKVKHEKAEIPNYSPLRFVDNRSTYLHTPEKKGVASFRITTAPKQPHVPLPTLLSPTLEMQKKSPQRLNKHLTKKYNRKQSPSPKEVTSNRNNRSKSTPDSPVNKQRPVSEQKSVPVKPTQSKENGKNKPKVVANVKTSPKPSQQSKANKENEKFVQAPKPSMLTKANKENEKNNPLQKPSQQAKENKEYEKKVQGNKPYVNTKSKENDKNIQTEKPQPSKGKPFLNAIVSPPVNPKKIYSSKPGIMLSNSSGSIGPEKSDTSVISSKNSRSKTSLKAVNQRKIGMSTAPCESKTNIGPTILKPTMVRNGNPHLVKVSKSSAEPQQIRKETTPITCSPWGDRVKKANPKPINVQGNCSPKENILSTLGAVDLLASPNMKSKKILKKDNTQKNESFNLPNTDLGEMGISNAMKYAQNHNETNTMLKSSMIDFSSEIDRNNAKNTYLDFESRTQTLVPQIKPQNPNKPSDDCKPKAKSPNTQNKTIPTNIQNKAISPKIQNKTISPNLQKKATSPKNQNGTILSDKIPMPTLLHPTLLDKNGQKSPEKDKPQFNNQKPVSKPRTPTLYSITSPIIKANDSRTHLVNISSSTFEKIAEVHGAVSLVNDSPRDRLENLLGPPQLMSDSLENAEMRSPQISTNVNSCSKVYANTVAYEAIDCSNSALSSCEAIDCSNSALSSYSSCLNISNVFSHFEVDFLCNDISEAQDVSNSALPPSLPSNNLTETLTPTMLVAETADDKIYEVADGPTFIVEKNIGQYQKRSPSKTIFKATTPSSSSAPMVMSEQSQISPHKKDPKPKRSWLNFLNQGPDRDKRSESPVLPFSNRSLNPHSEPKKVSIPYNTHNKKKEINGEPKRHPSNILLARKHVIDEADEIKVVNSSIPYNKLSKQVAEDKTKKKVSPVLAKKPFIKISEDLKSKSPDLAKKPFIKIPEDLNSKSTSPSFLSSISKQEQSWGPILAGPTMTEPTILKPNKKDSPKKKHRTFPSTSPPKRTYYDMLKDLISPITSPTTKTNQSKEAKKSELDISTKPLDLKPVLSNENKKIPEQKKVEEKPTEPSKFSILSFFSSKDTKKDKSLEKLKSSDENSVAKSKEIKKESPTKSGIMAPLIKTDGTNVDKEKISLSLTSPSDTKKKDEKVVMSSQKVKGEQILQKTKEATSQHKSKDVPIKEKSKEESLSQKTKELPIEQKNNIKEKEIPSPQKSKRSQSPQKNKETQSPQKNKETQSPQKNKEVQSPQKNKEIQNIQKNKEVPSPQKIKEIQSPQKSKELQNPQLLKEATNKPSKDNTKSPQKVKSTSSSPSNGKPKKLKKKKIRSVLDDLESPKGRPGWPLSGSPPAHVSALTQLGEIP